MPEKIQIDINGKDGVTPVTKKVTLSLKEMGEKVTSVGMRMTAAFTAPIVGLAAIVLGSEEVQAALEPVKSALSEVKTQLSEAFVPLIKEALPSMLKLVGYLSNAVTWFSKLTIGQQQTIVVVLALVAAIGPLLVILGQVMSVIGTLQVLFPALTAGASGFISVISTALAPLALFVAAATLLVKVIHDNWSTIQKFAAIVIYAVTGKLPSWAFSITESTGSLNVSTLEEQAASLSGKASGGVVLAGKSVIVGEKGPEIYTPGATGYITPNNRLGGSTTVLQVVYSPAISLASKSEIENNLAPYINRQLHAKGLA